MKFEEIINDLNNKNYKPIYFLMGEEPFYIDQISDKIQKEVLTEDEKTFNQTVLYGKDTDIVTIINSAKRYPMMAKYQVIIVKEAQNIRNIEELVHYAAKPLQSTVLVISYKFKKLAKNKKVYKEVDKNGVIFESKRLYDNEVPGWIRNTVAARNINMDPQAVMLLAENIGNDLAKIGNELDKLLIALPENKEIITVQDIEQNVGISKEYNNFELQRAVASRNVLKVNRIVNHFAKNPNSNPITLTISSLFSYFSKILIYHFAPNKNNTKELAGAMSINPYFIKEYQKAALNYDTRKTVEVISLLREYDMRSKGVDNVSTTPGELLKELTFRIIH